MKASLILLLDEIQSDKAIYDRDLAPPASAEELSAVQIAARQQLNYSLPAAYLEVLARSNGVDWNGFELYGTSELTVKAEEGQTFYERIGVTEANLLELLTTL